MDNGIWAVWYNLDPATRESHLDWLHGTYLPRIVTHPGVAWAAHYRCDEDDYTDRRDLLVHTSDDIPQGTQFICLVAAASPHLFFRANSPMFEENQSAETRQHLAERLEARTAVLLEEERVTGPAYGTEDPGGGPSPAIQLGSFNMTSPETDIEIGKWYAQLRMPDMARSLCIVRCRKVVGTAGWAKHGVIYEFDSHEGRREHAIHSDTEFSKQTVAATVHAPGSPSIGYRTWPPVD